MGEGGREGRWDGEGGGRRRGGLVGEREVVRGRRERVGGKERKIG